LEVIVITTYEAPAEWQGTVIYQMFSSSGNYLGEYVANVVIGPDPTYTLPDVTLEVSYENGQAYLGYGDEETYWNLGGAGWGFQGGRQSPFFEKASFTQCYSCPCYSCPIRRIVKNPRVRSYIKCTWVGSASGAAGCGIVSAFFAGTPFIPCLLGAGTAANTYCAITTIWPALQP
jgi:hypothetical protein